MGPENGFVGGDKADGYGPLGLSDRHRVALLLPAHTAMLIREFVCVWLCVCLIECVCARASERESV